MLAPAVYEGTISHTRRQVRRYGFRHRIAMAYVDLADVPAGLTRPRPGLVRFRPQDYLREDAVRDLVARRTGTRPDGPIALLTNLRVLGRCFNPVSFYYCFDPAAHEIRAVVAEVTNTPRRERHAYVLSDDGAPKAMHVSPFFGMDQHYDWSAGAPGDEIVVRIANREGGRQVFAATLAVRRRPMTRATLGHHALSSLRTGVLIYFHALALKLRGVPLHRHPEDQNEQLQGKQPGQPDAYIAMGLTAENVAERYGVTREQQDEFAQRSQERAVAAQNDGFFDREIVPVTLADGTVVAKDDGPRASSTLEKLASLEPAFKPGGTVTAGNSCPLNDGAAAALVMSDTKAAELGLKPRARIITAATWGNEPEYMGVAPIGAIKKVLERAGMRIGDVDVYELNEAFAAQVIPIAEEVGFDYDKLNPHGGAIALGHPFGMTGVRIMTTLLNDLETIDGSIGLETMCVAQGQGEAMLVERLS